MARYYVKIGRKTHRAYESEKVTRRVFNASIQSRIDKGYEIIEGDFTSNRVVLKKSDNSTTSKLVMTMFLREE